MQREEREYKMKREERKREERKREEVKGGERLLENYLSAQEPLFPALLDLPSDGELDASEAEFDRIVAERKPLRHTLLHWWPVAAAAAVVAVVGFGLYELVLHRLSPLPPREETVIFADRETTNSDSSAIATPLEQVQKGHPVLASRHPNREGAVTIDGSNSLYSQSVLANSQEEVPKTDQIVQTTQTERTEFSDGESGKPSTTDSLRYYLARLEAEMQAVDDSVAREHLEQLIAADVHLQQLVQRIVHAEVETAMEPAPADSTANYLNF